MSLDDLNARRELLLCLNTHILPYPNHWLFTCNTLWINYKSPVCARWIYCVCCRNTYKQHKCVHAHKASVGLWLYLCVSGRQLVRLIDGLHERSFKRLKSPSVPCYFHLILGPTVRSAALTHSQTVRMVSGEEERLVTEKGGWSERQKEGWMRMNKQMDTV